MKVEIPEVLAGELSELLLRKEIKLDVLAKVYNDAATYEAMERDVMEVQKRIDQIKMKITNEFIPEQYNSSKYQWFFNYALDGNKIEIREV